MAAGEEISVRLLPLCRVVVWSCHRPAAGKKSWTQSRGEWKTRTWGDMLDPADQWWCSQPPGIPGAHADHSFPCAASLQPSKSHMDFSFDHVYTRNRQGRDSGKLSSSLIMLTLVQTILKFFCPPIVQNTSCSCCECLCFAPVGWILDIWLAFSEERKKAYWR